VILTDCALVLGGFLAGSFPTAYVLTRAVTGRDIRHMGSGNVGATNVFRCVGVAFGLLTLGVDVLKGVAAAWAASSLGSGTPWVSVAAGVAAVAGHAWPPWIRGRGGKGVATAAGVFLVLAPVPLGIAGVVFLVAFGVSRMVSVGSMAGSAGFPVACWWLREDTGIVVLGTILAALIFWLHRRNILNLVRGREPGIGGPGEAGIDQDP
jgi:glycerol-3-phosphate acyltransferase PlsY